MKLSDDALTTFKKNYQLMYGVKLTDEEATRKGLDLLQFFSIIYKPIPKEVGYASDHASENR